MDLVRVQYGFEKPVVSAQTRGFYAKNIGSGRVQYGFELELFFSHSFCFCLTHFSEHLRR